MNRRSKNKRAATVMAYAQGGGSRLVRNTTVKIVGRNERTCLCDAIIAIMPAENNKKRVFSALSSTMPAEGDTKIGDVKNALAIHGLALKGVNAKFIRKGGAPFHILKETKIRLVIKMKLTSVNGDIMYHFVGWDGAVIYDQSLSSEINTTKDTASPNMSNKVFDDLYKKCDFVNWQITAVFELVVLKK